MQSFKGRLGEPDDDYITVWFWDPETEKELDMNVGKQFVPPGVESGDSIWFGTDNKGEIFIRKRTS